MNRRQWVALVVGLVCLVADLVFPYSRFSPVSPALGQAVGTTLGTDEWDDLYDKLFGPAPEGFRPIWQAPNPFSLERDGWADALELGVRWPVVGSLGAGVVGLTVVAVAVLGGASWRREMGRRIKSRARLSVRALMVGVVLVAVVFKAAHWVRVSLAYRELARSYAYWGQWPGASSPRGRARERRQIEWAHALARKYERASFRPWRRIEPDPPMPE